MENVKEIKDKSFVAVLEVKYMHFEDQIMIHKHNFCLGWIFLRSNSPISLCVWHLRLLVLQNKVMEFFI